VRARKTKAIAAIQLVVYGDDTRLRSRCGNPQALCHDARLSDISHSWRLRLSVSLVITVAGTHEPLLILKLVSGERRGLYGRSGGPQ
jgi:hypothetical protein